jgi:hypothetical protein
MSLVSIAELRALVQSTLTDGELIAVLDREEDEVIRRAGPHWEEDLAVVEFHEGDKAHIFTDRPVDTIDEIVISYDDFVTSTTLTSADYRKDDRMLGGIQRLIANRPVRWTGLVRITYRPEDDTQQRKSILIELVRIALERQALKQESIGGEYSYRAPDDWNSERDKLFSRLHPVPVWV